MSAVTRVGVTAERVARSIAVFVAASVALLVITAQFAPGWRAAGEAPSLDMRTGTQRVTPELASDRQAERASARQAEPAQSVTQRSIVIPSTSWADSADDRAAASGWVVLPASSSAGAPVPGVVLVHGAGHGDRDSLLAEAQALAASGVAAISYDKRMDGYSVLSRDYSRLADDAIAAASVLADQTGVDANRIGVMGWSEGGWVAPTAVQRAPDRFAFLALASAPIVSPLAQTAWTVDNAISGAPDWVRRIPATALAAGRPAIDYLDFDLRPALASVHVPILAVWGADDGTVPVDVAAFEVLTSVPAPVTVRVLSSTGHGIPVTRADWLQDAASWMTDATNRAVTGDTVNVDTLAGTTPTSSAGLAILPDTAWFTNPLLHGAIAAALAVWAGLLPVRIRSARGVS